MKRSSGIKRFGYEALRRLGQPTVQGATRFHSFRASQRVMKSPHGIGRCNLLMISSAVS
jgi:hypothetical protein